MYQRKSQVKKYLLLQEVTFILIDGTIRSNRTIDLNGVYLAFQNSGADVLKISGADVISFNNAYSFPTADGTAGQVLKN